MATSDFFLFPKLKFSIRGTNFENIEDIKTNSQRELKTIREYIFKKFFDDWIVHWKKCVASEWAYFEVDIINLDN